MDIASGWLWRSLVEVFNELRVNPEGLVVTDEPEAKTEDKALETTDNTQDIVQRSCSPSVFSGDSGLDVIHSNGST